MLHNLLNQRSRAQLQQKNNLGGVYLDYPLTNCTISVVKDRCLAHLCVKRVYTHPDRSNSHASLT